MYFSYMYKRPKHSVHMQKLHEFHVADNSPGAYRYFNELPKSEQKVLVNETLRESTDIISQAVWLDKVLSNHTES